MSLSSGLLLFAVIWVLVLFLVLPLRVTSQNERGDVAPGTPRSAPHRPHVKRKAAIVTVAAAVLWVIAAAVILSGAITWRDLDVFDRMAPADGTDG